MGRTIMDEDAIAAMETDRMIQVEADTVAKAKLRATLREYTEQANGPNGGRGPVEEGDLYQTDLQLEVPVLREEESAKIQPWRSRDGETSRAVNADELSKRLQGIPLDSDERGVRTPRPSPPTPSPTGSETPLAAAIEVNMPIYHRMKEYGDYNLLVSDGARPAYPIERLEAVQQNPVEYFELIYRWSHISLCATSPSDWEMFQRQLVRWEHFRDWQLRQRGKIDKLSLEKFIEKRRINHKRHVDYLPGSNVEPMSPERPIDKFTYDRWRLDQRLRARDRGFIRQETRKFVDFAKNAEDIRRRLCENGFTKHIDFDIDPEKQGQLATWAEYVDFELRWLSAFEAVVERAAPKVEKMWQIHLDEGHFSQKETVKVLLSKTFKDKLWLQEHQGGMDMVAAGAALAWLNREIDSDSPDMADAKHKMLKAAKERVHNTKQSYLLAARKSDAAAKTLNTGSYEKYKGLVAKQKALAQWAWDELLLIESESRLNAEMIPVASGERKERAVELSEGHTSETPPALQDTFARQRSTETPIMAKGAGSGPRKHGSLSPAVNDSVKTLEYDADGSVPIPSTTRLYKTGSAALQEATVAPKSTGLLTGIMPLDIHSTISESKQPDGPKMPLHDRVPGEEKAEEAQSAIVKTSHKRKRARTAEETEASNERLRCLRRRPHVEYSK